MTARRLAAVLALLLIFASASTAGNLLTYTRQPDPSFHWERSMSGNVPGGSHNLLTMTSQTWQGIPWTHEIEIVRPSKLDYPDTAILIVTGGHPSAGTSQIGAAIAAASGCTVAALYNIPNQPLYDGKREDALIAYTFAKAMETGDDTWPLLLPMTKSVVRAMDALQEFSKQEYGKELSGFIVMGASKRGWTTWLSAAADRNRVKAIIPMVYDNLNLPAQMSRQKAYWGKYSDEINDYTELNIQDALATEKGRKVARIVDPWVYRDLIAVPKLIVNAANDGYWTLDALNLYWKGIRGPKYVLYVPDAGHDISRNTIGAMKLISTSAAFIRAVASKSQLPKLSWKCIKSKDACRLDVQTASKADSALLWTARSDGLSFRDCKWDSAPMKATKTGFTVSIKPPDKGYLAFFGEANVPMADRSCALSTEVTIIGPNCALPPGQ